MVILMARFGCLPYSIGGQGNRRLDGTDKAPSGNARQLGGPDNKLAVHQDVVDSDREFIGILPGRAVRDPSRIEYRDVRDVIRSDAAAGRKPEEARRCGGCFAHGLFERQELGLAHVKAEDTRKCASGAWMVAEKP